MKYSLNKYQYLLLLLSVSLSLYTISTPPLWIPDEESPEISDTTQSILHRYYLKTRIQRTVEKLQAITARKSFDFSYLKKITSYFSHKEILICMQEIQDRGSFEPLWVLWHDIVSYKKLNDKQFSMEFVQFLFIILHSLSQKKNIKQTNFQSIDSIDIAAITYRFYLIKRLHTLFEKLTLFKGDEFTTFTLEKIPVTHTRVIECLNEMIVYKNLAPIHKLKAEFQRFKYCCDTLFTRDFLVLLLALSKEFSKQQHSHEQEVLYKNLSIEELLHSIDIISTKLKAHSIPKKKNTVLWFCNTPFFFLLSAIAAMYILPSSLERHFT